MGFLISRCRPSRRKTSLLGSSFAARSMAANADGIESSFCVSLMQSDFELADDCRVGTLLDQHLEDGVDAVAVELDGELGPVFVRQVVELAAGGDRQQ